MQVNQFSVAMKWLHLKPHKINYHDADHIAQKNAGA